MATHDRHKPASQNLRHSAAAERLPGGGQTDYLPPLLRRAWYGLNQAFRRRLTAHELTPDQYTVLRNLTEAGHGGLTQRALNDRMNSDPNTIAALVERMERSGWVKRAPDAADRRAKRVHLTSSGREKHLRARAVAAALHAEVAAAIPPVEQAEFLKQLARLADACQQALADSDRENPLRPKPPGSEG
ncbi:MAG: MarR family transcriptional regulator [Verrucomicrobiae bacterium]|nr:MarR family transcriptional regulator [Verrucomicrobiae bacterium]MCP5521961.1 MarR family transcriptional regulator [Verrucomicrobiales bacterium]